MAGHATRYPTRHRQPDDHPGKQTDIGALIHTKDTEQGADDKGGNRGRETPSADSQSHSCKVEGGEHCVPILAGLGYR
jgi:hypothetical protein